jgi:hypothetical protein
MYTAIKMTGKFYVMECVDDGLENLQFSPDEIERCDTFINEGNPVIFFQDVEDLEGLFDEPIEIVMVERD